MFIYQGQKAFYLWIKINPEIDQKLIELLLSKLKIMMNWHYRVPSIRKTTASKILTSRQKRPSFTLKIIVKKLYKDKFFRRYISKI